MEVEEAEEMDVENESVDCYFRCYDDDENGYDADEEDIDDEDDDEDSC